ncbi:MAG: vitamin K epoxide reductase family protein [Acidobacteriota bacterium]|nr:vitamin K epoxide reductase family protein [Acidobacteriota bacterium]
MGRKANAKREPKKASVAGAALGAIPNWPLLALSLLGCGLAGYLAWTNWMGGAVQGCSVGSGCDVVLSSRWATLLGLPTAFWGLLTYVVLAAVAFIAQVHRQWRLGWTIAFFGVLYSAYLTTISFTVLGAACPYCLTSLALMTSIFAVLTFQRPSTLPGFSWQRWLTWRGPIAVGAILFLHLNYTGVVGKPPAVEDPTLRALAVHLAESGAKVYGASWCPHCQQQKEMFGAAARRLPYIECSLGPTQGSPQTTECRNARITTYPTWEIDGKRYEEVLSPLRLAEMTRFDLSAAAVPAASP